MIRAAALLAFCSTAILVLQPGMSLHALEADKNCDEIVDGTCFPISEDYDFTSRYLDVYGSPMHYVADGSGDPIVLLHGNPTWSYIWRNIIPYLAKEGRVIAPDLIGMGKSGKPDIDYSFEEHRRYFANFIDQLNLQDITLVVHDWGSGIGLDFARRNPNKIKALVLMESAISTYSSWDEFPPSARESFKAIRSKGIGQTLIQRENIFIEQILFGSVSRGLTEKEKAFYRQPFPTYESRRPIWKFPNEVPIEGTPSNVNDAINAYVAWLGETRVPKLLFYVDQGTLITPARAEWARRNFPNLQLIHLGPGGHFVQEEYPNQIGIRLQGWLAEINQSSK